MKTLLLILLVTASTPALAKLPPLSNCRAICTRASECKTGAWDKMQDCVDACAAANEDAPAAAKMYRCVAHAESCAAARQCVTPPAEARGEPANCKTICTRLLVCKHGPWKNETDCHDACEAAMEDDVSGETYECVGRVRTCSEVRKCGKIR